MKKPPKNTTGEGFGAAENVAHYTAVLVEDLKDQFKFVIEHVSGMEERLIKRMDTRFSEHDARFDVIDMVLKGHSQSLQKIDSRLDGVESRLGKVESKLDHVIKKVERHDDDIRFLKSEAVSH